MKSLSKILLTSFIIYYICVTGYAQSDSVSVSTYEEPLQASGFKKREGFKYLKRSMIDEPSMLKITALPYWSGYYGAGAYLNLGYEKKINRSFSLTGEFVNYIRLFKPTYNPSELTPTGLLRSGLNISLRYYYGQKKEIRNNSSGNNLLSNYVEFKAQDILIFTPRNEASFGFKNNLSFYPNLIAAWGVQRRIRKHGYFDVSLGVNLLNGKVYERSQIIPYGKIAIGFGFSRKADKEK